MLFWRKKSLKKEFDKKLLSQMEHFKRKWEDERQIMNRSIDQTDELNKQVKIAELKYFYLFKEAKARKITINLDRNKR